MLDFSQFAMGYWMHMYSRWGCVGRGLVVSVFAESINLRTRKIILRFGFFKIWCLKLSTVSCETYTSTYLTQQIPYVMYNFSFLFKIYARVNFSTSQPIFIRTIKTIQLKGYWVRSKHSLKIFSHDQENQLTILCKLVINRFSQKCHT